MEIVENAISEAPLQRENKLLIGQTCVLEMIAAGAPLNETLTALTQFIEAQEDDLRCSILIVDDDGERFRRSAGPSLPESFHQALDGALVTSPYLGSCGEAAYHGRPVVVKDVATEQRYAEAWRALMLDCGVQACYSFPVRGADGNVLASFAVHRSQPGDPSPARPQLMEIATHLAGIAIERERSAVALRASKARQATELAATQQLQEFSTLLIQEDDPDALYRQLLDAAAAVMRSDAASVQLLPQGNDELHLRAWKGFNPASARFWKRVTASSGSTCGAALASGNRTIVDDVETCDFMAGTQDLEEYRRSGIRAVQSTPLMSRRGKPLGMISTHWREPHHPSAIDLRLLDVLARQAADLIERARSEDSLRAEIERSRRMERAAQQLAAIVESSDDAIASKDLNGIIQTWNHGAERLFGYTAQEAVGKSVDILVPNDHQDEEPEILARIRRGESIDHYDTVRQRKDGSRVDISLTVSPIRDRNGTIIGASKIARDISDRRAAEVHRELLLHELSHRVKNTLATVQSIAMQTLHSTTDRKTFQKDFISRLIALGHTHELLMRSNWHGASLHDLIGLELAPYQSKAQPRWTAHGDESMQVNAKTALALGMALHELATNAVKYGALSTLQGVVDVHWHIRDEGGRQHLHLKWVERGGPPVTKPQRRGFGSRLIEQGLKHELRAGVTLDFKRGGLCCDISLPLDTAQASLAVGAMA